MFKERKQKIILLSILGGIGILLILIVFFVNHTKYDFLKYKDKRGRFSISYPFDWKVRQNINGADVIFYSPKDTSLDDFQENVNVFVQDMSSNPKDLKEYTDIAIHQMEVVFKQNLEILESSNITLGGIPAHKLIFLGKGKDLELKYMCIWAVKRTDVYQVTYTSMSYAYDKFFPMVKRMVDSFKVL